MVKSVEASNLGGENAKNDGDCAAVYDQVQDPATSHAIGEIAVGEAFVIDCVDTRLTAIKVETLEGVTGFAKLGHITAVQFEINAFGYIPAC